MNKQKFKVGDKVRIIHRFDGVGINELYHLKEATATVEHVNEETRLYKLSIDASLFDWEEHWLEPVGQVDYSSETHDMVNKPKHYMLFPDKDIEVIDVVDVLMEKAAKVLNPKQLGYYTHLLGYLFRFAEKNGEEDLKKAKFYLDRIIGKND